MNDAYVEVVEIPDGTPQEMAKFLKDTLNKAYGEQRSGYSKRYGEIMEEIVNADWTVELKGTRFLFMEWRKTKFQSKEEFFGETE